MHTPACSMRVRDVWAATAVRKISGALMCEYPMSVWCSTAQIPSKPTFSAYTACSTQLRIVSCSTSGVPYSTWASKIIENFMTRILSGLGVAEPVQCEVGETFEEILDRRRRVVLDAADDRDLRVELEQPMAHRPAEVGSLDDVEVGVRRIGDCPDGVLEDGVRAPTDSLELGVVDVDDIGAEHHLAVPGVNRCDPHVGAADGDESLDRVVDAPGRCGQGVAEVREPLDGQGGEEAGGVAEVVGGRRVRHAGPAGDLPQAEPAQAPLGDEVGRRGAERIRQVAVVVAIGHVGSQSGAEVLLDDVKSSLYSVNLTVVSLQGGNV